MRAHWRQAEQGFPWCTLGAILCPHTRNRLICEFSPLRAEMRPKPPKHEQIQSQSTQGGSIPVRKDDFGDSYMSLWLVCDVSASWMCHFFINWFIKYYS